MKPKASWSLVALVNVLLPIGILIFAKGFFPYKPFLPGLAVRDAEDVVAAPFDKVIFMVVDALRRYGTAPEQVARPFCLATDRLSLQRFRLLRILQLQVHPKVPTGRLYSPSVRLTLTALFPPAQRFPSPLMPPRLLLRCRESRRSQPAPSRVSWMLFSTLRNRTHRQHWRRRTLG